MIMVKKGGSASDPLGMVPVIIKQQSPKQKQFEKQLQLLRVVGVKHPRGGSPLNEMLLKKLVMETLPTIFLEVGVFRGTTSIRVAELFDETPLLKNSFVLSMDTWLFDLRFVWNKQVRKIKASYFRGNAELSGSSQMYFNFLANVIASGLAHRIIPMQTASQNGAMALLANKIRPELIYVDASRSNPDVFIDYEIFYSILAPGDGLRRCCECPCS